MKKAILKGKSKRQMAVDTLMSPHKNGSAATMDDLGRRMDTLAGNREDIVLCLVANVDERQQVKWRYSVGRWYMRIPGNLSWIPDTVAEQW